jgi:hypothetical protein
MNNKSVGGGISETYSYPFDVIINPAVNAHFVVVVIPKDSEGFVLFVLFSSKRGKIIVPCESERLLCLV